MFEIGLGGEMVWMSGSIEVGALSYRGVARLWAGEIWQAGGRSSAGWLRDGEMWCRVGCVGEGARDIPGHGSHEATVGSSPRWHTFPILLFASL